MLIFSVLIFSRLIKEARLWNLPRPWGPCWAAVPILPGSGWTPADDCDVTPAQTHVLMYLMRSGARRPSAC